MVFVLVMTLAAALAGCAFVQKDFYVNPYMRHDGTYVPPHHRTAPDSNPYGLNPLPGPQGS